ncbi:HNH endonuclease [Marinobacterium rhizophilum]|uniref:HNH endonuclease n=1 Tax=Marinobacterium rhizophilum TaxID=420402 RepID=A0ABY5HK93_9GAMM|nr:HNH endonuclease signature motif containing protein [Marinobacterium rhizophilum]UTW12811.1 HNH endonuclease [Marinobacterium rhizophilum]
MALKSRDARAIELVRNGKSIVVANVSGELVFGPSRFIGYQNNSIDVHLDLRSERDGKETNPAIKRVLGMERCLHATAEAEFLRYCVELGVYPPGNKRQYWVLPDAMLLIDLQAVRHDKMAGETEKVQLQKARLGQGAFRAKLEAKWSGCCVTGCKIREVLRASHIKPWKDCTNEERLDGDNGLLLVANLDALFDRGLISFSSDGALVRAPKITENELQMLIGDAPGRIRLNGRQADYMRCHRELHGF